MSKFLDNFKIVQDTISDAAKSGAKTISQGINSTKIRIENSQLVQKRKDLFAELGRAVYESYQDGFPPEVTKFFKQPEYHDILDELKTLDIRIENLKESQMK